MGPQTLTVPGVAHRLHPHLVGPENIHDFGVCWFHTIAQLLEKISSVVHCVIFILKT